MTEETNMDNVNDVDMDMPITDERAFEELKKLLAHLPDDQARTDLLNSVAQKLLDL